MIQHDPGDDAPEQSPVPLVIMTHLAIQADIHAALEEIDRLDVVHAAERLPGRRRLRLPLSISDPYDAAPPGSDRRMESGIGPMSSGESYRRQEVAVMRGTMDRGRAGSMARRAAALCLGISLAGCAAMSQDVDAYYRTDGGYFQEAIDKAKVDATGLENQSRVLAVTGRPGKTPQVSPLESSKDPGSAGQMRAGEEAVRRRPPRGWKPISSLSKPAVRRRRSMSAPPVGDRDDAGARRCARARHVR